MRDNKFFFAIYATGIVLLLLHSLHAYFLWWMDEDIKIPFAADFFVAMIGFLYIIFSKRKFCFNGRVIITFITLWLATAWNPAGLSWIIYKCPFTALTLLLCDKNSLRRLLAIWTKIYAIVLLVSFIAWPLAFAGILPSYGIINLDGSNDSYYFQNHILCLVNLNIIDADVLRFSSVFLEPGHVAMIGAFTLYANHFDFKKWTTWIILIISMVTLSLAGYVLIAIGFLMVRLQKSNTLKNLATLVGASIVIAIIYFAAVSYNNGDNLVNIMIVERLQPDEEKGISGNNRFYGQTDMVFDSFLTSSDLFTGISREKYQSYVADATVAGAGYKMYLLEMGLLGTLLALFSYLLIAKKAVNKRFIYDFILLFIIAFLQRAWPMQPVWLYLFIFATSVETGELSRKPLISKKKNVSHFVTA